MLVLTRKIGEQVVIADNIRITIVGMANGRVKIGIEAPSDVKIDRREVHDRKQAEIEGPRVEVATPAAVESIPVIPSIRVVNRLPKVQKDKPIGPVVGPSSRINFPPKKPR